MGFEDNADCCVFHADPFASGAKNMLSRLIAISVAVCMMMTVGCQSSGKSSGHSMSMKQGSTPAAVAVIYPTEGNNVYGNVLFIREGSKVRVKADIRGLEPNGTHAIHVHEFGDITAPDGTSAGGHYNPARHDHALPTSSVRHAGDFGNLNADAQGNAMLNLVVSNISIDGDWQPVLGRAVIIHAKADDGGQPTGNAGGRIGFGVIGIDNPEK
jgi:Cu-Zn family superoxide dismutase